MTSPPIPEEEISIPDHDLLICRLCKFKLKPMFLDDFEEDGTEYERIWWVCGNLVNDTECKFHFRMPKEVMFTKRTLQMTDKSFVPFPNFDLLPTRLKYLYSNYFDRDGNFLYMKANIPLYNNYRSATVERGLQGAFSEMSKDSIAFTEEIASIKGNENHPCQSAVRTLLTLEEFNINAGKVPDSMPRFRPTTINKWHPIHKSNIQKQQNKKLHLSTKKFKLLKEHLIKVRKTLGMDRKTLENLNEEELVKYIDNCAIELHSSSSGSSNGSSMSSDSIPTSPTISLCPTPCPALQDDGDFSLYSSMEIPTPSEPRMLTPPPQQIPFASFGDPELDSLCMEFYDETINEVNEIVKKNQYGALNNTPTQSVTHQVIHDIDPIMNEDIFFDELF